MKEADQYTAETSKLFGKINESLAAAKLAVEEMAHDTLLLSQGAIDGKLETRAEASKHQGDFRKIVQGVNATLDAVVGPMQEVSAILDKLAGGDFTAMVTSKYAGDFDLLAGAVNTLSNRCARLWSRSAATFPRCRGRPRS